MIKRTIYDILKKFGSLRRIVRILMLVFERLVFNLLNIGNRVDEKTVLFEVFAGKQFSDSPKELYLQLINDPKYDDLKKIWVFTDPNTKAQLINNLKATTETNTKAITSETNTVLIKRGTTAYYRAYGRAKYWIANFREPLGLKRKKEQVYIQCWHGTPFKKLGHDITSEGADGEFLNSTKDIFFNYDRDARRYSAMLSQSAYTTEKFKSAFDLDRLNKDIEIIEEGYPRNAALFRYADSDIKRIRAELGIPKDKKVILYAPTFRNDQHRSGVGYSYKLEVDFEKMRQSLGEEYVILFRAHYFIVESMDLSRYEGFVHDVSNYDDPNDLYIISDILITDYSSVFFDYSNLKRPIIFHMYDKEAYRNIKDWYMDLEEIPGPVTETQAQLIEEIKNIEQVKEKYARKYQLFNDKYNYLDDGDTSKRVIARIFEG